MRELKFRAWKRDINVMYLWNANFFSDMSPVTDDMGSFPDIHNSLVLMQYIGYADINKVDIYEGDILKDLFNRILLVEWHNGGFCFKALTETNFKYAHTISQWFEFNMHPPLIIGNKYENPELIQSRR
jgi:uncharacterized phage protein (TIGR01671 family)